MLAAHGRLLAQNFGARLIIIEYLLIALIEQFGAAIAKDLTKFIIDVEKDFVFIADYKAFIHRLQQLLILQIALVEILAQSCTGFQDFAQIIDQCHAQTNTAKKDQQWKDIKRNQEIQAVIQL